MCNLSVLDKYINGLLVCLSVCLSVWDKIDLILNIKKPAESRKKQPLVALSLVINSDSHTVSMSI